MTRLLDITRDVCPMTTVKVGMTLASLAPGEELRLLVREEELKKVIASLKADGHRIESVGRQEDFFLLLVAKAGASADVSAARERASEAHDPNEEMQL